MILRRAAAWLAPSVALAALTTTVAALDDSAGQVDGLLRVAAGAGFAVMVALPVAVALALIGRAITLAWRPRALIAGLTDEGGGAPRLVGWVIALVFAALVVAWAANQTVWVFARTTAFKPRTLALLMPIIMIVVTAVVVLAARTVAAGVGWVAARIEAWWQARGKRPLFTPRRVAATGAVIAVGLAVIGWYRLLRPYFGHVATGDFHAPLIVVVALWAGHLAWPLLDRPPRLRRIRTAIAGAGVGIATLLIALAAYVRVERPTLVLTLWGDGGYGADAIDLMFDLYKVRDDVPAADLTPVARPGARHPDILLVTIDTLRPERTQPYGGPAAAKGLSDLAHRGLVFEWAFAPSNVTRRSVPAIATGLAPTRMRGRVSGWALRMDPRHVTLAERLRAGGYHTIGLFCCEGFWARKRRLGLDRGIDDLFIDHDGAALAAAYVQRVKARAADAPPTFTWIHFIELHEWAGGNPALTPDLRRRYDDILNQVDGFVAEIEAADANLPADRRPIVIVTADHGEALGDHGQPFHSSDVYNSQIRVPLIVAGPGVATGRISEAVSLLDVAPTVLDLAGFVPPGAPIMDGRSIADLVTGARAGDIERGSAYTAMVVDRFIRDRKLALVVGPWKLIEQGGHDELYDLRTDPNEMRDLAHSLGDRLRIMKDALRARQALDRASPF